MPLTIEQLPEGAAEVVDATIVELVSHGGIAIASSAAPTVATPLPVYHIGAEALVGRRGLAAATHVGWVATVRNGSEVMGSLELSPGPQSGAAPVRFGSFAQGPLHKGIAGAVDAAGTQAGRKQVRARLLRAPAVYLLALWLTDGDTDTLVPIAPAPAPLRAGEPMLAADALGALADAARQAIAGPRQRP